jgi:hypothetical protein
MKKFTMTRGLRLHSETLRRLTADRLGKVAAGFVQPTINAPSCNAYTCESTCPIHKC